MTQREILTEIRRLTPAEQLAIAETVLHLVREELPSYTSTSDDELRLAQAAEALREEYLTNKELTVFTVLDGEDFHV